MASTALSHLRRFAPQNQRVALIYVVGGVTALTAPLLLVVVALILQLVVNPVPGNPVQSDVTAKWLGGSWVTGLGQWPWFGKNEACLTALVALGAALAMLECFGLWWLYRLTFRAAQTVATQLHAQLQKHAYRLGAGDILDAVHSRPEKLFVDHVEEVRRGLAAWWRTVSRAPVALAALIALAIAVRPIMALAAVIWAGVCWGVHFWLKENARARSRRLRNEANQLQATLLSDLRLAPLAATYTFESSTGDSFEKTLTRHDESAYRTAAARTMVFPLVLLAVLLGGLFLLWVVGMNLLSSTPEMSLIGGATIVGAVFLAYFPLYRLVSLREPLQRARHAAQEISDYLAREPSVEQVSFARPQDRLADSIELDGVILADQSGRRLLDEVSLKIPARGCVALLASDLETPIALAGLLVRFYDPAAGRVLFDGRDLRHATLDSLRAQAALATGDGMLFNGRIADNLRCGEKSFTSEQLISAARRAKIHDFINQLPQKYVTILGQNGARLHVGQAFRVGLARALLRNPSVLVVEEPRSEIDEQSAQSIDEAIHELAAVQTVVIVPSRLSTLRTADQVFLFHEGKLSAQGTHTELLHSSELYRHLNYVRFNSFRRATT